MDIFDILNMIGGLSLFLYGMDSMGCGLSKMAGGRLETILERLTTKRVYGVLLGAGVTAVIQSSSATTVMVVGFVNSGIMKLPRAVAIIMGANIGTTITSWILSLVGIDGGSIWIKLLKPSSFSRIIAAAGIVLMMTRDSDSKKKDVGGICLGFATLMFGMEVMSGSVAGLANDTSFTRYMTAFSDPIIGMAAGAVLTAIIQSSSASVGILQALCATGAVPYSAAIPIIMGQNIGTCMTSIISSAGANSNARRAAMIHLYFNLIGTALFMSAFYALGLFVKFDLLSDTTTPASVAVIHSLFNVSATIVLFPFSNWLVRLAEITIPDRTEQYEADEDCVPIDERFLSMPSFAMELCRGKVREMADIVKKSLQLSLEILLDYDGGKASMVTRLENAADRYEDVLGSYLVKLSSKDLSAKDSQSMSIILHSISDLERISDHAIDIARSAEELASKGASFTPHARHEVETLCRAVSDICELTVECFSTDDVERAGRVEPLEEVIDTLVKQIKENHIRRLKDGRCTIEMGFILEDILNGLERVSDHCSNIAVEMITIYKNDYNTHEYFQNFSAVEQAAFDQEYRELMMKYQIGCGGAEAAEL